jgi:hypothetical protein
MPLPRSQKPLAAPRGDTVSSTSDSAAPEQPTIVSAECCHRLAVDVRRGQVNRVNGAQLERRDRGRLPGDRIRHYKGVDGGRGISRERYGLGPCPCGRSDQLEVADGTGDEVFVRVSVEPVNQGG